MMRPMSEGGSAPANRSGAQAGATLVLMTLAAGQFLMTLDTSVMYVAIATVAEDVGTRSARSSAASARSRSVA